MFRLRQVALVAHDLDAVVTELCHTLGLSVAYNDPGVGEFGLRNALMVIGDQFLEVVSPTTGGTTAGRLLDKRNGDGGYMAIFQADDPKALACAYDAAERLGLELHIERTGYGELESAIVDFTRVALTRKATP